MSAFRTFSALALLLLLHACGEADPEPSAGAAPTYAEVPPASPVPAVPTPLAGRVRDGANILLITVDTLRRDHLGCYGYFRDTSPTIDALAAESVLFECAHSAMATTYPSHLSILTGLYPHQHGVRSNRGAVRNPFASRAGCVSVARLLSEAGYETASFVSSRVLDVRTGISDGFAEADSPPPRLNPYPAETVTRKARQWLSSREGGRPFFLWLHYWDTHEPNRPPPPYDTKYRTDAELERWIMERGVDLPTIADAFIGDEKVYERFFSRTEDAVDATRSVDLAAICDLYNRYDGDLRFIDDEIGRFFDELKAQGVWEECVIAFTADHGQALGEHRAFGHGEITNVNTLVPLILRFPAGVIEEPLRLQNTVSLVDLLPTLFGRFEETSFTEFREQLSGRDLLSGSFDRSWVLTEESDQFHGGKKKGFKAALVGERWKYVQEEGLATELYDLEGPGEGVDVLASHPEVAADMERVLGELLAGGTEDSAATTGEELSEEEAQELIDNLRDLGYVGDD